MLRKGAWIAHRNRLRKQIVEHLEVIRGTIVESHRRCGKPNCRCQKGHLHGPYHLLTWSEEGRTMTRHIPRSKVKETQRRVANYRKIRETLQKLGEVERRLLLEEDE